MLEGDKILSENTCCLCLNDEESTFSANTTMKSMPLHEMVNFCIGVQLTDAQSYSNYFNLSTICNECVLNVNNFYAFKQKILTAQKALAECADYQVRNEVNMIDTKDNEMHGEFHDLTDNASVDMEMRNAMQNRAEYSDANGCAVTVVDDPTQQMDDEVEFLICSESEATKSVCKRTESTTIGSQKNIQMAAVAVKRRNPSKKKKVEHAMSTEKVAIQVNECLICPAVLSDILDLNEHAAAHTSIDCKVCHRSFIRYANLKRHFIAAHSKPKPFVCDLCGLGFSFSVNLQTHASLHYSGKIQMKTNSNK